MFKKEMICIVCPRGCKLTVTKENEEYQVNGNFCKRGIKYGISEIVNPVRQVTSTVKIDGATHRRLPVITDREIPKDLIFKVMNEINQVSIQAPVKCGEIIIKNVLNTDANIIASRSMEEL
ncbi:DUF1667 domain-containing protein [Mycoplasmatota bacterium]|nr:DUF1667 domain-containing protein [Mycoplasmatota bacterium]